MKKAALLGCGIVGGGVEIIFRENAANLEKAVGEPVELKYILETRDCTGMPFADKVVTDFSVIENDPEVTVVAECIGGVGIAYEFAQRTLRAGKSFVTCNKQMIAEKGLELLSIAREKGVALLFEASVGGGIPLLRPLTWCLAANRIDEICGIVNGTTNYILTQMIQCGQSFTDALAEAQKLGYAEADPSLDIDGFDTAHKACILSALAYGFQPALSDVQVEGIRTLSGTDVKYAADFGYRIKLLACVAKDGDEVEVGVHPTLIPFSHMLANVNDAFNAAYVKGDMSDYTMYYGRGAGRAPTASTVVGDIGDIARNLAYDETRYTRGVPNYGEGKVRLRAAGDIASKFYLRFMLADRPGAMGVVASALGRHGVSISALSQKGSTEGNLPVPVVAMTSKARSADLDAALAEIKASGVIGEDPVKLRVL